MADDSIIIGVELQAEKSSIGQIEGVAKKAGAQAGESFSDNFTSKIGFGIKSQLAAIGALIGAALFSTKAIDAAVESERSITSFNRALARTGVFSAEASQSFQDFAGAIQNASGIADEAVLGVATEIQNLAALSTTDLKRSTQAALDLSAALGIDLSQAALLVGKAANGQVETFGRLGIQIQKGKTDAETFANTLTLLESRFGGASAGAVNTFSGALKLLEASFGDIFEEFGKLTTNSPVLVSVIKEISKVFQEVSGAITNFGKGGDATGDLIKRFIQLGAVVTDFVIRPIEILFNITNVVFQSIVTGIQTVIVAFAKLAEGAAVIGSKFGLVGQSTVQAFKDISSATTETLGQFTLDTKTAFSNIGTTEASDKVDAFVERLAIAAANAKPIADELGENIKAGVNKGADAAGAAVGRINGAIQGALTNGIKQGVSRIGAALVQGGSAFNDFGKVVLGILGDLAIQIGGELVAIGFGIEALKTSLATLTGGAAIAAGLALIALGGVLKSFGGGGLSVPSAVSSGGVSGPVGGGFAPNDGVIDDSPTETGKKTEVNITIQGNVLDRRESGLEIASVLQEFFDTNNGVLVRT